MEKEDKERMHDIQSFIERCKIELSKEIGEIHQKNKEFTLKKNSRVQCIESRKKYAESEKGIEARKRIIDNRRERFVKACEGVRWEEMRLIKYFYRNCPKGYEVDHIVPLSKGGTHTLSNLQYLRPDQNRKKADSMDWEYE